MRVVVRVALIVMLGALNMGAACGNWNVIIRELAKSDRSWCASVSSVYGTFRASGTGAEKATVTCTQEGMTVRPADK